MRATILISACFIAEALNPLLWESYDKIITVALGLIVYFLVCDFVELFILGR